MKQRPQIVIVGGGAGGLELATSLGKQLGKTQKADITLIDQSLTHIWKPLLHEVAAGTLDTHEDQINYITHAHTHYFDFQLGKLTALDRKAQTITLMYQPIHDSSQPTSERILPYDILVIAIGSISNNYKIPGTDEHCYYLDSLEEAEQFQQFFLNQILTMQQGSGEKASTHLDAVIIGAGATGVELSAELYYALKQAYAYGLKQLPTKQEIKITLIEASDRVLAALPERISTLTLKELKQLGIDVLTNERVTEVTQAGVKTASGEFIPAQLKIWAAGIRGSAILAKLDGLETNRNNKLSRLRRQISFA